jgi:hypothetical protein
MTLRLFNASTVPANLGIENFSVDQLIGKTERRTRWKQFGVVTLGALQLVPPQASAISSSLVKRRVSAIHL